MGSGAGELQGGELYDDHGWWCQNHKSQSLKWTMALAIPTTYEPNIGREQTWGAMVITYRK